MSETSKTLRQAAIELLRELGPTHYQELVKQIISRGLAATKSKNPGSTLNSILNSDTKRYGSQSEFMRMGRGIYGLRELHVAGDALARKTESVSPAVPADEAELGADESRHRVRTPLFPTYREVRHLLKIWSGRPRMQIMGLQATLGELRGTPQNHVDWTQPDVWISERLSGDDRDLAYSVWTQSGKVVNPRYTQGHWLLSRTYRLVGENPDGTLCVTDDGREFIEHDGGKTETFIDEQEGLTKLLTLVADNGPTRFGGLLEEWTQYLNRYSRFGKPTTRRDTLRRRLSNLLDRRLIRRQQASMYSVTRSGSTYLQRLGGEQQNEILSLLKRQRGSVRKSLHKILLDMNPIAFEHLVKLLLEKMGYQDVEVTSGSGDFGVDVVANLELCLSSLREVVQAKRHRRAIQRNVLDALRGTLHRFNAVRGTIIATSRFAKGAEKAAFDPGVAPITLVDGERLIDLLIEHGIGVEKHLMLAVDTEAFADLEREI